MPADGWPATDASHTSPPFLRGRLVVGTAGKAE